jgi:ABC-type sugar transport system substrate-binding protein
MTRRRRGLRTVATSIAMLAFAVGVAACGGDDDGDGGGGSGGGGGEGGGEARTIAVNMYTADNPYFQEMLDGIEATAEEFGWEVQATFGNADPTEQVNQIQNAIATQPDALIVVPIDEEASVPPIRQAADAGIPVFTMGDNLGEEGQEVQVAYVGADYEEVGVLKAEFIAEELGDEGGTVGIIHGIRGLNFTEAGADGAESVFNEIPAIELIDGPYTGAFASDVGLEATENMLTRNPDFDAFYFDNDSIAIGGIQAIEERNIPHDEIITTGTDGTPAALEAVEKGTLDYTIHLCGVGQGVNAMNVIRDYLEEDTEPEKIVATEMYEITPANFEEQLPVLERDCGYTGGGE